MASAGNANTSYSSLRRAQLTYEYLHTNSTTHEFLFGALAELVDNARDASSQKIDIYTEPCESCRGRFRLCFLDDGDGMDPSEVGNVVQFGRSVKRSVDSRMIGQYGNGLKSGTMRIGKDMILFTRKGNTMSCLFLSRTFHEREKIEEVVVPMPSWDASTKKSLAKSKREMDKHQVEVNLILKYSPFKTEDQLFEQFNKIGSKGSLVVVYNLKLMDNGEPELDIESDSHDIKMADPYEGGDVADYDMVMPERRSFRAYAAILYLDPRMKIYIQKKKVQTKRLTTCLYKPKSYHFTSKRFKTRSEKEAEKADREAKIAEERLRELETQSREIEAQAEQTSKDKRVELRKSQVLASEARSESKMKTQIAEAKKKSMKEPKTLGFTFGFNIENRRCYGIFIYNCSRLIRMYERAGPQLEGGVKCYGVIGVVDVPYLVLEPTHNKQDFADGKEFRHLTRALGEHLEQYWKDSQIESQGVTKFWENFGYISSKWTDDPSNEQKYARKRAMQIPLYVQCDSCLKWRLLPFSQRNVGRELPDEWCCAMNPDPNQNSCVRAEQKVNITVGQLQKQIKTAEEKSKEIMEDIKKKQEKLEQLGQRQRPSQVSTAQKFREEERVRSQPQAVKKVERTSSVDSSTSSRSDRSVSPLAKKPVVDSTEGAGRRKQSLEPLKRRNADSTPDLEQEVTQPKRKKDSVMTTKNVVKSENQRRKEREQKDQEQKERQRQQQERRKQEEQKERRKQEEQQERRKQEEQQQQKQQQQQEEQQQETPVGATTETTDMEWSSEGENDGTALPKGTKVEARVDSDKWYIGTVFAVKPKKGSSCRVRVKFDMYPKDKYDKWFDHPSEDLRVLQPVESSPAPKSPSPTREVPSTTTAEPSVVKQLMSDISMPVQSPEDNRVSSMSDHTGDTVREPVLQDFVSMLRRCLCYFAPPKFRIKKEDIKEMSTEGLREFPLEQFFDDYEKGLTELVSRFQSERDDALKKLGETERRLEQRLEESDVNKRKLSNLRKIGAKLIRSLSEDPSESTISAEDDSDLVDLMLGDIANQAELRS